MIVASPSSGIFVQQVALAFYEVGRLERFETSFVWSDDGALATAVRTLPLAIRERLLSQLRRRALTALPPELVRTDSFWEIVRTAATQVGAPSTLVDRIWDHLSYTFSRSVARRLNSSIEAIYCYEYTALEAFIRAKERGVRTILDYPSLDSREFEQLQNEEKLRFPELRAADDAYYQTRFETRQVRRDAERSLADLIITNSSLTRASHVAAGAPPDRTVAVPLGAPPPVDAVVPRNCGARLKLIWAGTFSVGKGAHYLVEALRKLGPNAGVEVDLFGAVTVPDRVLTLCPPTMQFHGSVPREHLFAAFDKADVLVFPTLSDGFGMVVTEAFSRGLPVITTPRAGASDLVRHRSNGLIVDACNAAALAEAIAWCADNRGALEAMSLAALETARGWQWSDYRKALRAAIDGLPFEAPLSRMPAGEARFS